MIAEVDAVTPSQFEAWIAQQKANLAGADTAAQAARTKLGSQIGAGAVENP
jgi:heme/copper-type cytochrome/quinol oxidase subunit 2